MAGHGSDSPGDAAHHPGRQVAPPSWMGGQMTLGATGSVSPRKRSVVFAGTPDPYGEDYEPDVDDLIEFGYHHGGMGVRVGRDRF